MKATDLASFQNWMQAVVMHPEGVEAALAAPDAQRWIPLAAERVEDVVLPSAQLSGLDRIGIYARMYVLRLVECLEEDYRALRHALGGEAFDALARRYLADHPSTHYSLNQLGAALPGWLASRRGGFEHGDFLTELAVLERTIEEAFDAPRSTPLDAAALQSIAPDRFETLRLELGPDVRLLAFEHPVHAWYSAFREDAAPAIPAPRRTWLAVHRKEFVVWREPLTEPQHALLSALHEGLPLAAALERILPADDAEAEAIVGALHGWFQNWAGEGFFTACG